MFCERLNIIIINIKTLFHLARSIVVHRRVELSDNPAYSYVTDEHTNNDFTNSVYENVS